MQIYFIIKQYQLAIVWYNLKKVVIIGKQVIMFLPLKQTNQGVSLECNPSQTECNRYEVADVIISKKCM